MDAGLAVDVGYGADELGEDLLDLCGFESTLLEEVVVQLIAYICLLDCINSGYGAFVPGQYSRTSHTSVSVTITSYNRAMCGCRN